MMNRPRPPDWPVPILLAENQGLRKEIQELKRAKKCLIQKNEQLQAALATKERECTTLEATLSDSLVKLKAARGLLVKYERAKTAPRKE